METIEQQLAQWSRIRRYLDISYSYVLAKRMEEPRTNPVLGYRTAGSRAEFETGELLAAEMRAIGLSVEKHRFTLDGWDFHHARLTYEDEEGREHIAELGGYQTDFDTKGPRHYTLIDAGTGTAAELDRLDVRASWCWCTSTSETTGGSTTRPIRPICGVRRPFWRCRQAATARWTSRR